jgi:hypothetical protein
MPRNLGQYNFFDTGKIMKEPARDFAGLHVKLKKNYTAS